MHGTWLHSGTTTVHCILPSLHTSKQFLDDTTAVTFGTIPWSASDRQSLLMDYQPHSGVEVESDMGQLQVEESGVNNADDLDENHLNADDD